MHARCACDNNPGHQGAEPSRIGRVGRGPHHRAEQSKRIDSQAQAIKWRDAKIESITFQLAKLKSWKFGAKTERMNAEQREIFEDTLAADQADLEAQLAQLMRQERSKPLWEELLVWLQLERTRVPDGSAIARAIDYSLNHWETLSRFLLDGDVPIDNNHIENQMRPWALGRRNWLFIGSQLAGKRAAVVMSLLQSAKLNGRDPWDYLKDVLTRLQRR